MLGQPPRPAYGYVDRLLHGTRVKFPGTGELCKLASHGARSLAHTFHEGPLKAFPRARLLEEHAVCRWKTLIRLLQIVRDVGDNRLERLFERIWAGCRQSPETTQPGAISSITPGASNGPGQPARATRRTRSVSTAAPASANRPPPE